MMMFRTVKTALTTLLGDAAAGRFRVIGYQSQTNDGEYTADNNRLVQVWHVSSEFPKSGGSIGGSNKDNEVTYKILLTVSKAAKGNIATLNDPGSTPAQIQAALAAVSAAGYGADASFDELAEIIFQIIMDARNIDLGLSTGQVANRWIQRVQKDDPLQRGGLVVITGTCTMTCKVSEAITGDTPVMGEAMDTTLDSTIDPDGNIDNENIAGTFNDPTES